MILSWLGKVLQEQNFVTARFANGDLPPFLTLVSSFSSRASFDTRSTELSSLGVNRQHQYYCQKLWWCWFAWWWRRWWRRWWSWYKLKRFPPIALRSHQSSQDCAKSAFAGRWGLQFIVIIIIIISVTQHIPTMTNSHHGGFLSVMIMVGICQWQNPTIGDDEQISFSTSFFSKVL